MRLGKVIKEYEVEPLETVPQLEPVTVPVEAPVEAPLVPVGGENG